MDIDVVHPEQDQDIDLVPKDLEVAPSASLDLGAEQVPSDQGDIEILEENLEVNVHNIPFDESQHWIRAVMQSAHSICPCISCSQEQVIVFDVCKHLVALVDATKAYVEATNSSVRFLIAENGLMAKELQAAKHGEEQVVASSRAELNKLIHDEVSPLDKVMQKLYFMFVTMHKSFIHLNG